MKRLFFLLALGVLGAYFFRTFAYEGIYLATDSMAPTLPEGTHVFANKFVYFFRSPRRGEVIMFDSPHARHKSLVKRVIAVEGDSVAIKDKVVSVNDMVLQEPYVQYLKPQTIFKGDNIPPVVVPRGAVFVLGDNRDVSGDSRDWRTPSGEWAPFVKLEWIKGLVQAGE